MQKFDELKAAVAAIEADLIKFEEKGNKAAGGRVRKAMQEIKALAQEVRVTVQEAKNAEKE
jgi:predicted  nucleic acid-binding Zn-ribbon protein